MKITSNKIYSEMVRKKYEISSANSCSSQKRQPSVQRITISGWTWLCCSAFIISSCLISGNYSLQLTNSASSRSAEEQSTGVFSSPPTESDGAQTPELKSIEHNIVEQCIQNCEIQNNRTYNVGELESTCGTDCYMSQGCRVWETALELSCDKVCNKTDLELLDPKVLHCVRGCNDGLARYFKWIRAEVGTPPAPALVADSLSATSLALEWQNPDAFVRLSRGRVDPLESYLVQFRYEENVGDWKLCNNQSIGHNSTINVENLQPYTKYRFRVALQLSKQHEEFLTSEESVVISTLEQGLPQSTPRIVSAIALDHSRISISWEAGLFPNGPILSYVLEIVDLQMNHSSFKDIAATPAPFYMIESLSPSKEYEILLSMTNKVGTGPAASAIVKTHVQKVEDVSEIPRLLLGTAHAVYSQAVTNTMDRPIRFYSNAKFNITGIAIHCAKKFLFIADDGGFINRASLEIGNSETTTIIDPRAGLNFQPLLLSVDWLNDQLYILGRRHNGTLTVWEISRCFLDGTGMTVATGGLFQKPLHIEVDPFNGFLYWVISGHSADSGLYRLDLSDISNGVRHHGKPVLFHLNSNPGAFVIDHRTSKVLVPLQDNNTVVSVSSDGTQENIRSNTMKSMFETVNSMTMWNNNGTSLFYWTKGSEVIFEEYPEQKKVYFHNSFPPYLNNKQVFYVSINVSAGQPTPVPVNPPTNVQALLSDTKAKVSWRVPHLIPHQGKGAWQVWRYRLEVKDVNNTAIYQDISATHHYVDLPRSHSEYTFRVAAYTDSGIGPWSGEFTAKSLSSRELRRFVWSTPEGLFEGDMLGEQVTTLLTAQDLQHAEITDLSWFENMIYMAIDDSIKSFNRVTKELRTVIEVPNNFAEVKSIAIDWIGRQLYWSSPTLQTISRCELDNSDRVETTIIASAKDLQVDSLRGFVYYATDNAVEAYRPSGKNKTSYYQREQYSRSIVIGLTLDMAEERVYWIVRSFDRSTLYSAAMIRDWTTNLTPTKIDLGEMHIRAPLIHFSDRLLWLRDDNTSVIADMTGRNVAQIDSVKFSGIQTISVIDPTQHKMPTNVDGPVMVIPERVNESSIRTIGTWSDFNITWAPVTNVNYGTVFYEVSIRHGANEMPIVRHVSQPSYEFFNGSLHPYTSIEVKIRAYTYWGTSGADGYRTIMSPSSEPYAPTNLRVFVTRTQDLYKGTMNSTAFVRWNPPTKTNGVLTRYLLTYCDPSAKCKSLEVEPHVHQKVLEHLSNEGNYTVKVAAKTEAGLGNFSDVVTIQPKVENPLPRLLVGTMDQILKVDLDLNTSTPVVNRVNPPATHVVHISKEKRVIWTNEIFEIWSCIWPQEIKVRVATLNTEPLSLALDWVYRNLFWVTRQGDVSQVYMLDLNKFEEFRSDPIVIISTDKYIRDLVVSPLDSLLVWLEFPQIGSTNGEIRSLDLNTFNVLQSVANLSTLNCGSSKPQNVMMLDTSFSQEDRLIWSDGSRLMTSGLSSQSRGQLNYTFKCSHTNHVKDSVRLYWIGENMVEAFGEKSYNISIPNAKTLISFYHQKYPNFSCLVPVKNPKQHYMPKLLSHTPGNITLLLPEPEMHWHCSKRLPTRKHIIFYAQLPSTGDPTKLPDCNEKTCKKIHSFDLQMTITGLKPFTRYRFQVGIMSHYAEHSNITMKLGPATVISTAPGAPSAPLNLGAEIMNPQAIKVQWNAPEVLNSESIYYVVHYEFEDNGSKNHRQINATVPEILLQNLHPNLRYKIWIHAHATLDTYSSSNRVEVTTFPRPEPIRAININSTSLTLVWQPQDIMTSFVIIYEESGKVLDEHILYDSNSSSPIENKNWSAMRTFFIGDLAPKTSYTFSIRINYINSTESYLWPSDVPLKFETLGGVPSAPGMPIWNGGSTIIWEPSKDNGATILEYYLEGCRTNSRHLNKRSTEPNSSISSLPLVSTTTAPLSGMNKVGVRENATTEVLSTAEQCQTYNTGTNNYWQVSGLADDVYLFRVRAKNSFGFSPFSPPLKYEFPPRNDTTSKAVLFFGVPGLALAFFIVICIALVCRKPRNSKNHFIDTPITDVELANLREMPRGAHFSNNILYRIAPLTDSEIAQLPQISRDKIVMTNFLGSGAFGEVYEGCVKYSAEYDVRVAIKTLRKGATEQEKMEFLQEAQLMSNFKHEHILGLIGICYDRDNMYIIMELMQGGDLLSFLRQSRPSADTPSALTLLDLVTICVDVASGCRYLEEMHFVHRDLACRNCLVSNVDPEDRVVKIGDFGLARDIYRNDYYRKEGEGLLPVRWMSPESLVDGVFTSQSDIWAFGVLCWEIMTLGQQPYPAMNNMEVLNFVRNGGRLGRPSGCPDELYQLMLQCWKFLPGDRPTFRYSLEVLEQLKANTSSNIELVLASPDSRHSATGGIFNRSYLLADDKLVAQDGMSWALNNNNVNTVCNNSNASNATATAERNNGELCDPKHLNINNNNNNDHAINYNIMKPVLPPSPLKIHVDPSHVELPPEGPKPKPKYLELIYDPDDMSENSPTETISQQELISGSTTTSSNASQINSGYEIPITDLILRTNSKYSKNTFNDRKMERLIPT